MTPSLVGLLDNCCKRSSSPLQISSDATVAASDPVDGKGGGTFPLGIVRISRASCPAPARPSARGASRAEPVCRAPRGRIARGVRPDGRSGMRAILLSTSSAQRFDSPSPRRHSPRRLDRLEETSACGFARPETLLMHDADVSKPSRLRDLFEARRRVQVHRRNRQRQKEHVFPRLSMLDLPPRLTTWPAIGQFMSLPKSSGVRKPDGEAGLSFASARLASGRSGSQSSSRRSVGGILENALDFRGLLRRNVSRDRLTRQF